MIGRGKIGILGAPVALLLAAAAGPRAWTGGAPVALRGGLPAARQAASRGTAGAPAPAPGTLRLVVAGEGNEARYRVREQLVHVDLPNDAVGVTHGVTGGIVLDSAGRIVPAESRFVVDVTQLASDRDRRDRYVQHRTLETAQYPSVQFVPKELRGLPSPLPTSGNASFDVIGDLTVRGVTRPVTWHVDAKLAQGRITGTGSTAFTFADFDLPRPRVPVVLSVADTIHLEYDFALATPSR